MIDLITFLLISASTCAALPSSGCSVDRFIDGECPQDDSRMDCFEDPCDAFSKKVTMGDCLEFKHCCYDITTKKCFMKRAATITTNQEGDKIPDKMAESGSQRFLVNKNVDGGISNDLQLQLFLLGSNNNNNMNNYQQTASSSSAHIESFGFPPHLHHQCAVFPGNCYQPKSHAEMEVMMQPPVDIPYCQRRTCSVNDSSLHGDRAACYSNPGCYFDSGLWELRYIYGEHILPGVSVCYMGILNRKFHDLAEKQKQADNNNWNALYTRCFLEIHKEEVLKRDAGCYVLEMMEMLDAPPKVAGWKDISSGDCILMGGCPYQSTGGCYYPGKPNQPPFIQPEQVSSSNGLMQKAVPCQPFNSETPDQFLTSYHECLSAGCSVDPVITPDTIKLMFYKYIVENVPKEAQSLAWWYVVDGTIQPWNYQDQFEDIIKQMEHVSSLGFSLTNPLINLIYLRSDQNSEVADVLRKTADGYNQFLRYSVVNSNHHILQTSYSQQYPGFGSHFSQKCFFDTHPLYKSLKGSFTSCCDRSYCVLPKESMPSNSGIASYWGFWSSWGDCTAKCGGQRARERSCIRNHGHPCPGDATQTETCNQDCIKRISSWSAYSECTTSCGTGQKSRSRDCVPGIDDADCIGQVLESTDCGNSPCPALSVWSSWTGCSASCGAGTKQRSRSCLSGQCRNEQLSQETECSGEACPLFNSWMAWSECTYTCGGNATKIRFRTCGEPGNDEGCIGKSFDITDCDETVCPVYSAWSEWGSCSATCGVGERTRRRECIPSGGNCEGNARQTEECDTGVVCPVYAEWLEWGACSVSCGSGGQTRLRRCLSFPNCFEADLVESRRCGELVCPAPLVSKQCVTAYPKCVNFYQKSCLDQALPVCKDLVGRTDDSLCQYCKHLCEKFSHLSMCH